MTAISSWHVEPQTLIVLGGRADIKCISSVQRPAVTDDGVVADEASSSHWQDWCFVEVIRTVDLLVDRFSGIEARKVERELDLVQKIIPQLEGAVSVDHGQPCN